MSVIIILAAILISTGKAQDFPELEVSTRFGLISGLPVSWGNRQVLLLQTNGGLAQFPADEVISHRITNRKFLPLAAEELAAQFQMEFGNQYKTVISGPFLIVAPSSSISLWSERFTALYASFHNFCLTRQITLRSPPFLMPAIVFRTRDEFVAYSKRQNHHITASTLGYYSLVTNRIALYEYGVTEVDQDFFSTATTIIHEATHQAAFNTGIHNRIAEQPLWLIEGLATLFEAPGVFASTKHRDPYARINLPRLANFRSLFPDEQSVADALPLLITDDRYFDRDPDRAYSLSWMVTYYTSENFDSDFAKYLKDISVRSPGSSYSAAARYRDFEERFGNSSILARELFRISESIKQTAE